MQFILETLETICKLIGKRKQIEVFQNSQKSPKRKRQKEDHQLDTVSNLLVVRRIHQSMMHNILATYN